MVTWQVVFAYLWGHGRGGATTASSIARLIQLAGHAKVCELDQAVTTEQQVFHLDVSVQHALHVDVLQCLDDTSDVEACIGF